MRFFALVAIAVVVWPATALGATAKVSKSGQVFRYTAAVGEANDVTASVDAGHITLEDPGASIKAGRGCNPVSPTEVTCSFSGRDMEASLGDLSDSAALTTLDRRRCWFVTGGDGADTLRLLGHRCGSARGQSGSDVLQGTFLLGSGGNDALTGTPGSNWLDGGPGNDTLLAKSGNDLLFPGLGDDTVDGGRGGDNLFFFARASIGVTADLETGVVTGGQGNDTLAGVECLEGSKHGDRFFGDSRANCFGALGGDDYVNGRGGADDISGCSGDDRLFGGRGPDLIQACEGDDLVNGGPGRDRLHGNEGDDRIRAKDGLRDRVLGGAGFDRARVDRTLDRLNSIERVRF
jgi:Ca2+-binding RTX toxin-like protein